MFSVGRTRSSFGLVASLSRPGGNVTGITSLNSELAAKRLGLLHDLLPNAVRFGVLVNPSNPPCRGPLTKDAQAAGSAIGRQIEILAASSRARDRCRLCELWRRQRVDALVVSPDPLFDNRRVQIVTLAAHRQAPRDLSRSARLSLSAA